MTSDDTAYRTLFACIAGPDDEQRHCRSRQAERTSISLGHASLRAVAIPFPGSHHRPSSTRCSTARHSTLRPQTDLPPMGCQRVGTTDAQARERAWIRRATRALAGTPKVRIRCVRRGLYGLELSPRARAPVGNFDHHHIAASTSATCRMLCRGDWPILQVTASPPVACRRSETASMQSPTCDVSALFIGS